MEKYRDAESVTGQLSRAPEFTVRTGDHSKVSSYIQFQFNVQARRRGHREVDPEADVPLPGQPPS
jgi:hypothetical protein